MGWFDKKKKEKTLAEEVLEKAEKEGWEKGSTDEPVNPAHKQSEEPKGPIGKRKKAMDEILEEIDRPKKRR